MTQLRLFQLGLVLCTLWISSTFSTVNADQEVKLRDAVEYTLRQGLPNWLAKAEQGGEVRVAYLGGSITAQPGWRVKTMEWFRQQYPNTKFTEINAAIGGTGSMLGAYRLRHDVLRHRPDLLFVEFAVNDAGAPPDQLAQTMEGIVRHTWLVNPQTDICFVYTLTQQMLKELQSGKFPRAASVMERVADHYGIPSIHMGVPVARLEQEGKLIFTAPKPAAGAGQAADAPILFSGDGVHPYTDSGHEIYFQAIKAAFAKLPGVGKAADHCVCEPLSSELWQRADLIPITAAMVAGPGWEPLPADQSLAQRFGNRLPGLWRASQAGDSLTFRFRGTQVGFYDLLGPDCGQLAVAVDGAAPQVRPRFDGYCTYHRLSMLTVAGGLPDQQHTVTVKLLSEPPDKEKILHEHRRPDLQQHPEKYAGTNWYVGAVLLIGQAEQQDKSPTVVDGQ